MNNLSVLDVVIVEDEPHLAGLHRDFIEQNFNLRVVGLAATLNRRARYSVCISQD